MSVVAFEEIGSRARFAVLLVPAPLVKRVFAPRLPRYAVGRLGRVASLREPAHITAAPTLVGVLRLLFSAAAP